MNDWTTFQRWLPAFAAVMDPRMYRPEWLAGEVWSGRVRFWGNERAALTAELRPYPTGACDVHVLLAAGEVSEVVGRLRPIAEQWARDMGCLGAIVESRAGWAHVLKNEGYRPYQLHVRKEF